MDALFLLVNDWMGAGIALAALGCFLWGMISVLLSPCHLASIPLVVAYMGGQEQLVKGGRTVRSAVQCRPFSDHHSGGDDLRPARQDAG